jgi:uncharacterized protein (UPF0262 family)
VPAPIVIDGIELTPLIKDLRRLEEHGPYVRDVGLHAERVIKTLRVQLESYRKALAAMTPIAEEAVAMAPKHRRIHGEYSQFLRQHANAVNTALTREGI